VEKVKFQRVYDSSKLRKTLKELEREFIKPGSLIPLVVINSMGAFLSDSIYEDSGMGRRIRAINCSYSVNLAFRQCH